VKVSDILLEYTTLRLQTAVLNSLSKYCIHILF
jgi:hypothetical protein